MSDRHSAHAQRHRSRSWSSNDTSLLRTRLTTTTTTLASVDLFLLFNTFTAIIALTPLVGRQEEHPACKY